MRRAFPFHVLLLVLFASLARAEDPTAEIVAGERAWAEAAVTKDLTPLEALLHPSFRLVVLYFPDDAGLDRRRYLAAQVHERSWAFRAMDPERIEVTVDGAVAVAKVTMTVGWPEGVDRPTRYLFTDIWANDGAGWRVVTRLSQLAPDPG